MNVSNLHSQSENAKISVLFIKYSKIFEAKSLYKLNKKINDFEESHPHLTLVTFDDFTKTVPVYGKYVFSDDAYRYSELIYTYKIYKEVRYYTPDPDLANWLNAMDEFASFRKEKIYH
jgi:hypothetical protein